MPAAAARQLQQFLGAVVLSSRSTNLAEPLVRAGNPQPFRIQDDIEGGSLAVGGPVPGPPPSVFVAKPILHFGDFWFDRVHILPRGLEFGNVISTILEDIEIYSAFLATPQTLLDFINNAGVGTDITDLPSLPTVLAPQRSLFLTLEVLPQGQPTVDTTLDFQISLPYLLQIPISLNRIVAFPYEPEAPLRERLLFLTDILEHVSGSEQRISLREAPRREFDFQILLERGLDRQRLELLLFDGQNRVFGVPVWIEPTRLTADASVGQTSVNVESTAFASFREGGLAILYVSETEFEIVEITTFSATVLNIATPLENTFSAGIRVMPLRPFTMPRPARDRRWAMNLTEYSFTLLEAVDREDLSDVSAWPEYDGKVLLDDPNAISTTLDSSLDRNLVLIDGETGEYLLDGRWDRNRRSTTKRFIIRGREHLWQVRQLLYGLRGRQISFWLPTFSDDLRLVLDYTSGGGSITVANVGYAANAQTRVPKRDIRVTLTDGTVLLRRISSATEIDEDTEQLALSTTIPQNIDVGDVRRIEFLELVRIDTDRISLQHFNANGEAEVSFPVRTVFE